MIKKCGTTYKTVFRLALNGGIWYYPRDFESSQGLIIALCVRKDIFS